MGGGGTPTATPTATSNNPAVGDAERMGDLRLTSSAFEDGGPIPEEYGRGARNVNPPLAIEGVPAEAASLTLVVDDPDAVEPAGEVWLHWLVWNVPPSRAEIPEDWEPTEAVEGENDFGNRGYGGPAPPEETHTYRFKLYALDTTPDLPESADEREVGRAMRGALLARTQLTGTYSP
ncbi:MAG: YbhB/YbcL family Raf kinase inhibitor-like protein [Haloarculaceae archaeon]